MNDRRLPRPGSISPFRAPASTRPPLAPHVAKALGISPGSNLQPASAHPQRPAVQRAAAPGGLRLPGARGRQAVRGAVVQCNGTVNEEEGNPGFWYTGETRTIKEYLYADVHMGDYGDPSHQPEVFKGCQGTLVDHFQSKGSIIRIQYRFGNWNVFVPWPTVWMLLGQDYYPAPNRYGFVPSAEFGNPSFMGETMIREDLTRVTPFAYKALNGTTYTPEVDFIFGEAISSSQRLQLFKEAKTIGVKAAVQKVLNR